MKFLEKFINTAGRYIHKGDLSKEHYQDSNLIKLIRDYPGEWSNYIEKAKKGPKILIATSTGGHEAVTPVEELLGAALTVRGANVHYLLCDKFLPGCLQATTVAFKTQSEFPKYGPQKSLCKSCFAKGLKSYKELKLPVHLYSEFVTKSELQKAKIISQSEDLERIKDYRFENYSVGEHSLAGALRYFARASLDEEKYGEKVLRRYFEAGLITAFAVKRLFKKIKFERLVFHHGIYIPQGIIGEVARKSGVPIVNWNPAYRKKCFIFSHGDTYHHTLMNEPVSKWEKLSLTKEKENRLLKYLKSRMKGTKDWIWFHEDPQFNMDKIARDLQLDLDKPIIGMLTNVMWDAQLHYPANAFPDMLAWIKETIKYFMKRSDLQLVIRIHPAEIRGTLPSRQKIADEIEKAFPALSENIKIILPESSISTYTVMEKCNSVIIYGTKMGVELTSMGMPVIVAGEAWIRNKGLTMDAKSVKHYFQLLDKLPIKNKENAKMLKRARKYAYHFFFRRMIPVEFMKPQEGWPPYRVNISEFEKLNKGQDHGLDTVVNGILKGSDFIYSI